MDAFEPVANGGFGQFEDLTWAALPDGNFTKWEGVLVRVTLFPEVVHAVRKQFGRDFRLILDAESVDGLAAVRFGVGPLSHLEDEIEFGEGAVEVVLHHLALFAAGW